jgi:hypothetical protein
VLEDMKTSLVSENMPSLERQDPSNSGSKSAGVVKRVPLVGSSEIYVDDEMDSSRSQPDNLFGNEIEFRPYHRNWFDVIGIWVENRIKSEICWWPLRSPVPPQESGLTQMSWKCVKPPDPLSFAGDILLNTFFRGVDLLYLP